MRSLNRYVVAGCNGRFGTAIGRKLRRKRTTICGIDVHSQPTFPHLWDSYVEGSITDPAAALASAIRNADCVILCVPEQTVIDSLPAILPHVAPTACVADIASVKTRVAAAVADFPGDFGYLSFHPMFAPVEDFAGRNIVVVPLRETDATRALERLIETWRATITKLAPDEHDRLTAYLQVVPHVALLAFGSALLASGQPIDLLLRAATPVHLQLVATLMRILRGGVDTCWSIQVSNPYASEARQQMRGALHSLIRVCECDERATFSENMQRQLEFLEAQTESALSACAPDPELFAGVTRQSGKFTGPRSSPLRVRWPNPRQ